MAILGNKNIILLFLFVLIGCNNTLSMDINSFPKSFSVLIYERGKPGSEIIITENDKLYKELYTWYSCNLNEWVYDFNSYVPSVLLYSDNFKINLIFGSKIVIINYLDLNGEWRQVKKRLLDDDVSVLNAALAV